MKVMNLLLIGVSLLTQTDCVPLFTPVQIVRPNAAHTGFEVVKETLAQLATLGRNRKIALVSVVGPYHSGKSFLLNALIGKTDVFTVGPKTSPETMGLWVARTNLTVGRDQAEVWFLDSEGFFGPQVPETYDAKTFTLSLLLGDEFVYNTVKIIDSQAVNLLEMLARRAQLFRTKTESTNMDGLKLIPPHLTWVVEDFVQATDEEGQSKTRWLEQYLKAEGVDEPYLKKIFPELSVKSLFLPATTRQALVDLSKVPFDQLTPEFRADLSALRQSILERLANRSSYSSASEVAQSIQFLATALDQGLFPELPSLWQSWKSQVVDASLNDAIDLFDKTMREKVDAKGASDSMPSVDEFNRISSHARNASLVFYSELVHDFLDRDHGHSMDALLFHLEEQLKARHTQSLETYTESIRTLLREKSRAEFSAFLQQVPKAFGGQDLVEPKILDTALSEFALAHVKTFQSVVKKFEPSGESVSSTWPKAGFPAYKLHPVDELRVELLPH
jgi:hypothetical protein